MPASALSLTVSCLSIGRPALSTDELATWSAVSRTLPQLVHLLTHVDAVLGLYYLALHAWCQLFGYSEVALRTPSALAVAATVGTTTMLGARLADTRTGVLAGLLLAVLPAATQVAQTARVYGLVMLLGCVSLHLLLCVTGPRRARRTTRLAYALSVILLGCLHLVACAAILPVHLYLLIRHARRLRSSVLRTAGPLAVAILALMPLVYVGYLQRHQLDWVDTIGFTGFVDTASRELVGSPSLVLLLGVLVGCGVAVAGRSRRVLAVWALAPITLLLATAIWVPRYAVLVVPAWTILAGRCAAELLRAPIPLAVLLASVTVAGIPRDESIRRPDGHGFDTRAAAVLIADHWRPGDGLIYRADSWTTPLMMCYYQPGRAFSTPLAYADAARVGWYTGTPRPPTYRNLGGATRLWYVRRGDHAAHPFDATGDSVAPATELARHYRVERSWLLPQTLTVLLLTPKP
ncbi:glycosyltransferase family 39 protein [Actinocatenispora sera]|uniref:glycosyltransferase family 39 protein n=1 Tax=Actinocatenispora sera TaxID=390989 RepID=UPI0033D9FBDC